MNIIAQRRMFSLKVVDTDDFLDMPLSAQALYFHLSMRADDDGFVDNPKKILRMTGCRDDDMNVLLAKKYIIPFETGICVIRHWKIHNYIQKDRYSQTIHTNEKKRLIQEENGMYTECIQDGYTGKDSIGKDSIGKDSIGKDSSETLPPQLENKDISQIQKVWNDCRMIPMNTYNIQDIVKFLEETTLEVIEWSIKDASEKGIKTFAYVKSIILDKINKNMTTVQEIEVDKDKHTLKKKTADINNGVIGHGYTKKDFEDMSEQFNDEFFNEGI